MRTLKREDVDAIVSRICSNLAIENFVLPCSLALHVPDRQLIVTVQVREHVPSDQESEEDE